MAGEIAEIGPGVTGWKVGERVLVNPLNKKQGLMGEMLDGGMEEFCLIAADQLIRMPDGVSYEEAASLPVAYGTAHRMLATRSRVRQNTLPTITISEMTSKKKSCTWQGCRHG